MSLNYEWAELSKASQITGVPEEKIKQAAEMLTGAGGERPKASFGFEKGNYWSNNYLNTASYAGLALCAGNRPGQVIARLGGHQRGWIGWKPQATLVAANRPKNYPVGAKSKWFWSAGSKQATCALLG